MTHSEAAQGRYLAYPIAEVLEKLREAKAGLKASNRGIGNIPSIRRVFRRARKSITAVEKNLRTDTILVPERSSLSYFMSVMRGARGHPIVTLVPVLNRARRRELSVLAQGGYREDFLKMALARAAATVDSALGPVCPEDGVINFAEHRVPQVH